MSITKVEVRTTLGMLLVLPLDNFSNGYLIEDIAGVDPVSATIVTSTFANFAGAKLQASRRGVRNIIFKMKFKPDYINKTARELRTELYSFFAEETDVSLRFFMSDGLTVDIEGRVEDFDSPLFTSDPKVTISILCVQPDFLALTPVDVEEVTVEDLDEFLITYEGSVPTGFKFVMNVDRTLDQFTIYHRPPDNNLRTFDFAADLEENDILTINSVRGDKYIDLLRVSTVSSLLYGRSPQSPWLTLMPGVNRMRVHAVGAAVPFTITYTPRYGTL